MGEDGVLKQLKQCKEIKQNKKTVSFIKDYEMDGIKAGIFNTVDGDLHTPASNDQVTP